jgi:hypothetical protein
MPERPSFVPEEAKDFKIYDRPDEEPYFNKKDHAERSKANQPNHNKFWKKKEKGNKENDE